MRFLVTQRARLLINQLESDGNNSTPPKGRSALAPTL